jgi:trafficking protein particle complex subunit 12
MASVPSHSRKPSSRAALPRRTTKGPLDAPEDPLTSSATSVSSSALPFSPQNETNEPIAPASATTQQPAATQQGQEQPSAQDPSPTQAEERDLSFLLDSSIYHVLSQVDVPGPFRKPFLPPPRPDTPLSTSVKQLEGLLSQCDFLRAANLAGSILISGSVRPADVKTIFRLLEIRYSCLELSGNLLMAAQEAKALEDLSSGFYYDDLNVEKESDDDALEGRQRKVPEHIMPFSLRLQALRLQSIGFSDPRRGISSLYDVGMECREHLSSPTTTQEQRELWTNRLQEVSIRVVNAMVEMSDLDTAARTLASLKPAKEEDLSLWASRMILLRIKMGDVSGIEQLIESLDVKPQDKPLLESLVAIAQGRFDAASKLLSVNMTRSNAATEALVKQNLAVAYLYRGEILKARQLLGDLVEAGNSFQTLTVNLATIYDLTSDRSRELKGSMASRIASHQQDRIQMRSYMNADFKL